MPMSDIAQFSKALIFVMVAALWLIPGLSAAAGPAVPPDSSIDTALDRGYLGLLAIAFVRDKDKSRALQLLSSLRSEFPGNTLFPREISRLQSAR